MALRLGLQVPHLSIRQFPDIHLSDLTVITGRNGSGKSHLLQAIEQGKVVCDKNGSRLNYQAGEIRRYDWTNLVPKDTGLYSSETSRNEKTQAVGYARNMLTGQNILASLRSHAQSFGVGLLTDKDLITLSAVEIDLRFGTQNGSAFVQQRENLFANSEQFMRSQNQGFGGTIQLARSLGKSIFSVSEDEILYESVANYGSSEIFQQSFAKLFVEYRDTYLRNEIRDNNFRKGKSMKKPLSDEEFIQKHGPAPWDFVNKSLKRARLDFEINTPSFEDYSPYQPKLTKTTSGDEINFGNLSSGEKVIMSFAFCLYYASDKRQIATYPKCLLLDEIDAPLHPAMTRSLLSTINDILVNDYQISVIMTSHSPSTVALCPDESVCIMQDGMLGLRKSTKNEALNILTEGVPTVALSYDGRRHVFVESNADASNYPLLYDLLKSHLQSERSLEFISTGVRGNSGEERNTGCSVVKKLVSDLSSSRHNSVYGLLDWDGKHQASSRIFVLAEGSRNGLENAVLDPLVLAAFICRRFRSERHKIGVDENLSYFDFFNLSDQEMQRIVTALACYVLGSAASDSVVSEYCNGARLDVDRRYFEYDDHVLEALVLKAFPPLKGVVRGAGTLMHTIISEVMSDNKGIIPKCIRDVFYMILSTDTH